MRRLSIAVLAAVAAGVGTLSWVADRVLIRGGATPLPVPWTVTGLLLAAGGTALWLGSRVRSYKDGDRPGLDPIQAARTAMFAQAAAYSGAALVGIYVGHAAAVGEDWGHEPRREVVIAALVATAAALALTVAGVVAERWCSTGNDDGDGPPRGDTPTPGAA